jgi:simple sugar transport system permease protein
VQFEGFGSTQVFFNLFSDNAFLIIAAVGMTFVILSGGIDLSVGAVIALTGVVCSVLISRYQLHPLIVFPIVLIGGTIFGAIMGAIIHYYKMQPFIVTLAGMFFARGLASVISEESIPIEHEFYNQVSAFGFEVLGGAWIGSSTIICLVVLVIAIITAHYTRFGGRVYAIGGDANSAALMGIPLAQTTIRIYATRRYCLFLLYLLRLFAGRRRRGVGCNRSSGDWRYIINRWLRLYVWHTHGRFDYGRSANLYFI